MVKSLRPAQIDALAHYISNERTADISDPGTGKTAPACVYIQYLYDTFKAKSIWAMPKSLLRKNYYEILEFTDLKPEQVVIIDGTPKQRQKLLDNDKAVVFLMGFKRFVDDWSIQLARHPQINALIIDEIHMGGFKSATSKSTTELFNFMKKAKYFLAMSGTLIDGRLDSCYATIHIIEPRYYANHYSFLAQHCIKDDYGNILGWYNHEKLGRIFLRHCFRRTFEEVYGPEAKVFIKQKVEMDALTRAAYKEFGDKACLELDEYIANELDNPTGFLESPNGAVAAMRSYQIMQHPHHFGIIKDEDVLTGKEEAIYIHCQDHLNSGKPLIIFSALIAEQERLYKLLTKWGFKVGLINSSVPSIKRGQIDVDFQSGKLNAVVGSPGCMAVGYNWGHVDHVIFPSVDFADVNFVQAYKRTIRGVRTCAVRITILEYLDSIDNRRFKIIDGKSRNRHKVDSTYEELQLSVI